MLCGPALAAKRNRQSLTSKRLFWEVVCKEWAKTLFWDLGNQSRNKTGEEME